MSRACDEPHVACEVCGYIWCLGEEPSRCDHGRLICDQCFVERNPCRECVRLLEDGYVTL